MVGRQALHGYPPATKENPPCTRHPRRTLIACTAALLLVPLASRLAAAVTLEQDISREDPKFNCAIAVLTVGRDGNVYLSSIVQNGGYILRVSRDGTHKLGGDAVYAMANATANAAGVIASANGHFNHSVNLYDRNIKQFAACNEFLVNDKAGWDAPGALRRGQAAISTASTSTAYVSCASVPPAGWCRCTRFRKKRRHGTSVSARPSRRFIFTPKTARSAVSDSTARCGGRRKPRARSP